MEYNSLSIHWGHDASISFIDKEKKIRVFEYERFCRVRYATLTDGNFAGVSPTSTETIINFFQYVKKNLYQRVEKIYYSWGINQYLLSLITNVFGEVEFIEFPHHFSHVCSGFYQSSLRKALVFSLDGGGNDYGETTNFCVYKVENGNFQKLLSKKNINIAVTYRDTSFLLKDINPSTHCYPYGNFVENYGIGLADPGKIMGLCAYGKIREEWIENFKEFLTNGGFFTEPISKLCDEISVPFGFKSLDGEIAYDVAATMQETFKRISFELMRPIIDEENLDVIFVGGCALNVLFNQYLYEYLENKGLKMFVPPNPSDCGITHGFLMSVYPELISNNPYIGYPILDEENIQNYLIEYTNRKVNHDDLTNELLSGKIIGVINGNSEIGPRALGNRSIICYPSFKDMKNILNSKVKFREWYRPFAPVCKLEDKDLYFDKACESKYMSYAPVVKEEFREKLSAITHVDGTARLQTVRKDYNSFFYTILESLQRKGEIPIILNTSFNIKGRPILTTFEDAFHVLDNTEMDYVLYKDILFSKKSKKIDE